MFKKLLLCGLLVGTPIFFKPVSAQENEIWEQRIERLEADFRRSPRAYTLSYLAEAREAAGLFDKADASWDYLKSRFGDEESDYRSSDTGNPKLTYAQLVPWMKQRVARKRNLQLKGEISAEEKGRALRAAMKLMDPPPVRYLHAQRNIDVDGDGIDEVVVYGRSAPAGKGKINSMAIWRWDGKGEFQPIWSTYDQPMPRVEYADHNREWNNLGDKFMEVVLFYEGKVQTVYFNGQDVIYTIVNK